MRRRGSVRVSLFATCLVDQFFPEVGESMVKVLRHLGVEVDFPPSQTCCGQLAFNTGYHAQAASVARRFFKVFAGGQYVVAPSGSCVSMVRAFAPELLRSHSPSPLASQQAEDVASRTYEFSQFLVRVLGVKDVGARLTTPTRVTFHDACHGLRELGVRQEPRDLIRAVQGAELVEMDQPEACCGFGGTFSVKFPEISSAMLQDKVDNIKKSGADLVVALDTSCLMHIAGALSRQGASTKAMHLAELLAQGIGG